MKQAHSPGLDRSATGVAVGQWGAVREARYPTSPVRARIGHSVPRGRHCTSQTHKKCCHCSPNKKLITLINHSPNRSGNGPLTLLAVRISVQTSRTTKSSPYVHRVHGVSVKTARCRFSRNARDLIEDRRSNALQTPAKRVPLASGLSASSVSRISARVDLPTPLH